MEITGLEDMKYRQTSELYGNSMICGMMIDYIGVWDNLANINLFKI